MIGLFIEEKIPRGMSMAETIDAIQRQGGLVYVPHPFDRLHAVPDYEHLLKIVEDIDILEVFNARDRVRGFNEEARALRRQVPDRRRRGLGQPRRAGARDASKIRMRDFDGPEEFLESLRDADILHKRKSLIYLQALKFLQTTGARSRRAGRAEQAGRERRGVLPRSRTEQK